MHEHMIQQCIRSQHNSSSLTSSLFIHASSST